MKKILFVSDSTRVGGIQKSLINMLNNIDYSKYDVSLFLFNDKNTEEINKNVRILPSIEILRIIGSTSSELKKTNIWKYFFRRFLSLCCYVLGSNIVFSIIYKSIKIDEEFDIAISYSNNVSNRSLYFGYNKLVIEKVKSRLKKCWVHIDYTNRKRNFNEVKEYKKMDNIILVSKSCKKSFDNIYPEFKNKTSVVYNIVEQKDIGRMSKLEKVDFDYSTFNIISIGRIEANKNFEDQLIIAKKLKDNGIKFKWYVIGNGVDFLKIQREISELDIDDVFTLIGEKKNVYPYIKEASLLVSTSLSESFGLTIAEALMLKVPVIALKYPALEEIIKKDYICNNLKELYERIFLLITNKNKYNSYKKNSIYIIKESNVKKQIENVLGG